MLSGRRPAPEVVVYTELVMTARQYMHVVSAIDLAWLPELAPRFYAADASEFAAGVGVASGLQSKVCMHSRLQHFLSPLSLSLYSLSLSLSLTHTHVGGVGVLRDTVSFTFFLDMSVNFPLTRESALGRESVRERYSQRTRS